jgi:carbonic anhydrase
MKRFERVFSTFSILVLLTATPSVFAGYAQSADPDMESLDTPDPHTAAALERSAQSGDSFKKITKVAPTPSKPINSDIPKVEVPSDEIKIIKKPIVESEAAPKDHDPNIQPSDEKSETEETPALSVSTHAATLKPIGKHAAKTEHAESSGVTGEQSLKWLANGNNRYVKKLFRKDGRMQADRTRTFAAQHPHAIVLSCSDSRVPPELVFDQGLGEIFTVRTAGEALDDSVIGSIEYAVEHFHPHLLVVMGHTKCGAVEAALESKEGESAGSEHLDHLLAEIRPHLKSRTSEKPSPNVEVESALNADGVARDLVSRSEIIRKQVDSGELLIKPALYWLDSGKVKFY